MLLYLLSVLVFGGFRNTDAFNYGASLSQRVPCGFTTIDPTIALCCSGLVYIRSGPRAGCCGMVGYDTMHYYCCGTTIQRKDIYKQPRCCGEVGYDGLKTQCVNGYLDKRTNLGSQCCLTDVGWKCCSNGGSCCASYQGSGQVDIPGFRPACCHLQTVSDKAGCCALNMEKYGILSSCCTDESVRPKCCERLDGSRQCCSRWQGCCLNNTVDGGRPHPVQPTVHTNPPWPNYYTTEAPRYVPPTSRSGSYEKSCCTLTRRSCCNYRELQIQPCCYTLNKPRCCSTTQRYLQTCCVKQSNNNNLARQTDTRYNYNNNPVYQGNLALQSGNQQHYPVNKPGQNQGYYQGNNWYNQGHVLPEYNQNNRYPGNIPRETYDKYGYPQNRPRETYDNNLYQGYRPGETYNTYQFPETRPNVYDKYPVQRPIDNNIYNRYPTFDPPHGNGQYQQPPGYQRNVYPTLTTTPTTENPIRSYSCCGLQNLDSCCQKGIQQGFLKSCCESFLNRQRENVTQVTQPSTVSTSAVTLSSRLQTRKLEDIRYIPEFEYAPFRRPDNNDLDSTRPIIDHGGLIGNKEVHQPGGNNIIDFNTPQTEQGNKDYDGNNNYDRYQPSLSPTPPSNLDNKNYFQNVYSTSIPEKPKTDDSKEHVYDYEVFNEEDKDEWLTDINIGGVDDEDHIFTPENENYQPDTKYNYHYEDFEELLCEGRPYNLGVYICCDDVLRWRVGVEPRCCSTEAYDGFYYHCCDGIIKKSCDTE